MRPDVIDLNQFYASPLGQVTRRLIRRRIREIWPNTTGLRVLGMGYATPFLRPFRDEAERLITFMPAPQGVVRWPPEEPGLVALTDETELPLEDSSIDRVVMVHALENSEQVRPMLREVWRVLASGGRVIVVVPNRRGIWARVESTPFGHGYPFSPRQLTRLLRETMFSPMLAVHALYMPPTGWRTLIRTATALEKLGNRWSQVVSGILVVEASKQIYAMTPEIARRDRKRRPRVALVAGGTPRGAAAQAGPTTG